MSDPLDEVDDFEDEEEEDQVSHKLNHYVSGTLLLPRYPSVCQ